MKYANTQRDAVFVNDVNGKEWTIPRGHRFWSEWGIDKAESEGRIDDPDPVIEPGGGSGV
ncbi:hypothetical protein LGV68_21300 [Vibrio sp. LQ2]|uniref:hypothetical protein n=1 Tax=Vibrio sp. LQ2 TaxID=2883075 RepID=UPI00208EE4D6|nr:hypothetical protein [Vibrio sp. LQ2]USP05731.1 hypothetical protein LGV68_21300 [Vibrio sp. LQ2]